MISIGKTQRKIWSTIQKFQNTVTQYMLLERSGERSFVEVSCAALVMLGKPMHNSFQERVLS
jgi:hypothetical protein